MESSKYLAKFQCDGMWSSDAPHSIPVQSSAGKSNRYGKLCRNSSQRCKHPSILILALHHTTRCSPLKPDVSAYAQ